MKYKSLWFLLFVALCGLSYLEAKKLAEWEEIGRPEQILISNGYIYVKEKANIFIYNLKDFTFVKKFGREGEGPSEFKITPFGPPMEILPYGDKLLITSWAKVSIFSKIGEFIREQKVNSVERFSPFSKKIFVCLGPTPVDDSKRVMALFLSDNNFKKGKLLHKSDISIGQNATFKFPFFALEYRTYKEKLFVVAKEDGFAINIFDPTGKKIDEIKRKYTPIQVDSEYRDKTLKWFKTDPNWKGLYDYFKQRISFKKNFPIIYQMIVANDCIYVFTYKMKDNLRECIVMDTKGKEIKRVFLPAPLLYGLDFFPNYIIYDNYFYYLIENEDEEIWELHNIKID